MSKFIQLTQQQYGELLNKTLFKTFFHSLEWQEFLEKEFKWLKFEHYLYKDELLLSFGLVGKKLISLPFCEYGGPLPIKENIDFERFKKDVLEEFKSIKIKFHPKILDYFTSKLDDDISLKKDISTYWINNINKLSEHDLFSSFRLSTRQRIRKGSKENLLISTCQSKKDLKIFYNLYIKTMKKNKTLAFPIQVFKFLWKRSVENKDVDFLIIKHNERMVAGMVFLFYSNFAHYFLSAMDHKYIKKNKLNPTYFLLWEEIKHTLSCKNINTFDFGGTRVGTYLEEFKRGWGTKEYPILRIELDSSRESLRGSKIRDIWGLMPNYIIKKISPYLIKYRL